VTRKPFAKFEKTVGWEPRADPRAAEFYLRRAEQSMQFRYWARYGHELPKVRKAFSKESQGLAALE